MAPQNALLLSFITRASRLVN